MKIVVYAICKNEAQFVSRWIKSMSEADQIVVLDTGSTDDTVQRLRALGAQVTVETICPWRFDVARNRSLELVDPDADICVCTDLDEVFHPGWRKALESAWIPGTTQATYRYTWSFRPDGGEGVVFWYEKIHARHGYRWIHPVHEVLEWMGPGQPGLKSRQRASSWTTTPTRKNPGPSTCLFWNWRCQRRLGTTAASIIWAGSTCSTAGGTTASAP